MKTGFHELVDLEYRQAVAYKLEFIFTTLDIQQCVKSVQTRSFFWSVFSHIDSKYGKIRTGKNSVLGYFSRSTTFVIFDTVIHLIGAPKHSLVKETVLLSQMDGRRTKL